MTEAAPRILCFGEILWDFLPAGLFAGGAPFNVGYHLKQQGADVHVLSAVGRDVLGDELLRRLRNWQMNTHLIGQHDGLPTGYVRAALGEGGDARYEIVADVAWDRISVNDKIIRTLDLDAVVFGSLAQRSSFNRTTLQHLLSGLPAAAWRVFDVNLRTPYDDLDLVRNLAKDATLLKLNAEEAARLCDEPAMLSGSEERQARDLARQIGCRMVCITSGSRGAGLLCDGNWHWEAGRPIAVADTIGAGDAFLASLLIHLRQGTLSHAESLACACRTGEWVASQNGATPSYSSQPKNNE